MDWDKYIAERQKFRELPVSQQLEQLMSDSQESDAVIGEIYIQNPPEFIDKKNKEKICDLLGNALLIEEYAVAGQGDNEFNMLFAVGNLLIGVKYFAYWRTPFSMIKKCKVYRYSKGKSLANIDLKEIKKILFGC